MLLVPAATALAAGQRTREELSFRREYRGKQATITAELQLPLGTGRVPAMIIHHGSGGVTPSGKVVMPGRW